MNEVFEDRLIFEEGTYREYVTYGKWIWTKKIFIFF